MSPFLYTIVVTYMWLKLFSLLGLAEIVRTDA